MTDAEYEKLLAGVASRDGGPTKERLERKLEELEFYCQPKAIRSFDDLERMGLIVWIFRGLTDSRSKKLKKLGYWPSRELLEEIAFDVLVLAGQRNRVKPIFPVWKAFEKVDKHAKSLRLESRVNDLIRRAQRLLSDGSALARAITAAQTDSEEAQSLYKDMLLKCRWDPQKLGELLLEDRVMAIQRCMALPLANWVIGIGHPFAKDFGSLAEFFPSAEEIKALQKREKRRDQTLKRVHRHRYG